MVYKRLLKDNLIILKKDKSEFRSSYNEDEKENIANIYKGNKNFELFNGKNVRLENVYDNDNSSVLILTEIRFYDFISTNMLYINYDKWIEQIPREQISLLDKGMKYIKEDQCPIDFDDIISRKYISNMLAVSVLISDRNDNYMFVRRNSRVAISSDMMSVSVTGSLDDTDFRSTNPILSCVIRETKEELGIDVKEDMIKLRMLVAGEKKLQPIVLCDVVYSMNFENIVRKIYTRNSFKHENSEIFIVKKKDIKNVIEQFQLTEAALEHVRINMDGEYK